jgi:hypothetical protein
MVVSNPSTRTWILRSLNTLKSVSLWQVFWVCFEGVLNAVQESNPSNEDTRCAELYHSCSKWLLKLCVPGDQNAPTRAQCRHAFTVDVCVCRIGGRVSEEFGCSCWHDAVLPLRPGNADVTMTASKQALLEAMTASKLYLRRLQSLPLCVLCKRLMREHHCCTTHTRRMPTCVNGLTSTNLPTLFCMNAF